MLIQSIVNLAREYLLTGVILVLAVVALFVIYHFTLRKYIRRTDKKINRKRLMWWFVFLCYIFMVFAATMFSRNNVYEGGVVRPLLYSYKSAWNGWVKSEWRNIILNYIMFVPFGFLLPLGTDFLKRFYRTALAGFFFSLFIEVTQRVLKVGIFELDDLLNNTLGAMIGYGLFTIAYGIYGRVTGKKKIGLLHVILANIPLVMVGCVFATILLVYSTAELGNNNNHYITAYRESLLTFSGAEFTDDTVTTLPVYKCDDISKEEATELAGRIFKTFGKGEELGQSYFYEDAATFRPKGQNAILWVKYRGGTYEIINYNNTFNDAAAFTEEEVRDILSSYGYVLAEGARFIEGKDNQYSLRIDMHEYDGFIWNGRIDVRFCADRTIKNLQYSVYPLSFYKNFEVKSQAEAFGELKAGKFKRFDNKPLDIEVLDCQIEYSVDAKGFYQPNYRFYSLVNGKEAWIMIPAIK